MNVDLIKKGGFKYQCNGGERANPRNLRQLPARRILSVPRLNLTFQFLGPSVEFLRMLAPSLQLLAKDPGPFPLAVFQHRRSPPDDAADGLMHGNPVFRQQLPHWVGLDSKPT